MTPSTAPLPGGNTILVEIVDRVAWVTMNRPEKRNATNPTLSFEMLDVFEALESDERCGVVVLTGAGDAYSSGMDLREYFRATDKLSYDERLKDHAQERHGAMEAAAILRQADHRHGQRLVLRDKPYRPGLAAYRRGG
jgi:trans-feruloyl-CoA hydratase/vanillin synthase